MSIQQCPTVGICICELDWNLIIQSVSAFGTIAVCIIALWADYFRNLFASPKLKIVFQNIDGELIENNTQLIYHLKVINERKWALARNTRVVLHSIHRKNENGNYIATKLNIKTSFKWSPYPIAPYYIDLLDEHEFDFGILYKDEKTFQPCTHFTPVSLHPEIQANQTVRYDIRVIADNYYSKKPFIIEVTWNGKFSIDIKEMKKNINFLKIKY